MSKLRLDLDTLEVESFDTRSSPPETRRGTVRGHQGSDDVTLNLMCQESYGGCNSMWGPGEPCNSH